MNDLNKFRVPLRMVEEEVLSGFRDCTISVKERLKHDYDVKKMSLTIDGSKIHDVPMRHFRH